jgi:hypothetical protein
MKIMIKLSKKKKDIIYFTLEKVFQGSQSLRKFNHILIKSFQKSYLHSIKLQKTTVSPDSYIISRAIKIIYFFIIIIIVFSLEFIY